MFKLNLTYHFITTRVLLHLPNWLKSVHPDRGLSGLPIPGPEEVNSVESKYGGTPLHWALSKSDVNQLIKHGAKTDTKSNTKDTPLHIMIKKKRTDAAYCLILNGADVTGLV